MNDLELLKLAAKAGGIEVNFDDYTDPEDWFANGYDPDTGDVDRWWNPLRDYGDALRLAVALRMKITVRKHFVYVKAYKFPGKTTSQLIDHEGAGKATLRAIVSAAAEKARWMP